MRGTAGSEQWVPGGPAFGLWPPRAARPADTWPRPGHRVRAGAHHRFQLCGIGLAHKFILRVRLCALQAAAGRRCAAWFRHRFVGLCLHPARPGAFQVVLAFVGCHTHQPLLIVLGLAPVNGRPCRKEGILGQILGGMGVVDKLQTNGINQFLVLLHQLGKICLVQCPHLLSHSSAGALSLLEALLYTNTKNAPGILQREQIFLKKL